MKLAHQCILCLLMLLCSRAQAKESSLFFETFPGEYTSATITITPLKNSTNVFLMQTSGLPSWDLYIIPVEKSGDLFSTGLAETFTFKKTGRYKLLDQQNVEIYEFEQKADFKPSITTPNRFKFYLKEERSQNLTQAFLKQEQRAAYSPKQLRETVANFCNTNLEVSVQAKAEERLAAIATGFQNYCTTNERKSDVKEIERLTINSSSAKDSKVSFSQKTMTISLGSKATSAGFLIQESLKYHFSLLR